MLSVLSGESNAKANIRNNAVVELPTYSLPLRQVIDTQNFYLGGKR